MTQNTSLPTIGEGIHVITWNSIKLTESKQVQNASKIKFAIFFHNLKSELYIHYDHSNAFSFLIHTADLEKNIFKGGTRLGHLLLRLGSIH